MADTTPSLVWMCDSRGRITYLNERRIKFTGRDPDAGYGDTWNAYVHPDDQKNALDEFSQALNDRKPFSREYRLRRSDGVYRWMFDVASPRVNGDGSFAGFIGSAHDVTDQKLAQQALEKVSGQLIEAQEKERSRIARELHDDICQRLALLSMELEQRIVFRSSHPKRRRRTWKKFGAIALKLRAMFNPCRISCTRRNSNIWAPQPPSGVCQEFSRQHEVIIEFTENDMPRPLPQDISLCLFRMTQEALHNAVKYSGVGKFAVELTARADEIQLIVRDAGTGFDVEQARKSSGLGLVSMQERVHLVHGNLSVESKPGTGTIVLAVVPLALRLNTQKARRLRKP
jgi:PAS domain S-box-containing protein